MIYRDNQFGDFGFSLKKIGRAVTSGLKTISTPVTVPVKMIQDVKNKGLKKALKAVPSRLHVDTIKAGIDFTADTARMVVGTGTKVDTLAKKAITGGAKLQTWTQKRPLQTTAGVIAAGAAGYVAFVAAPAAIGGAGTGAAAAGAGGAGAGAGSGALTGSGSGAASGAASGTIVSTAIDQAKDAAIDAIKNAALQRAKDLIGGAIGGSPTVTSGGAPIVTPLTPPSAPPKSTAAQLALPGAGAAAGFVALGPVGALVGAGIGYLLSKRGA